MGPAAHAMLAILHMYMDGLHAGPVRQDLRRTSVDFRSGRFDTKMILEAFCARTAYYLRKNGSH